MKCIQLLVLLSALSIVSSCTQSESVNQSTLPFENANQSTLPLKVSFPSTIYPYSRHNTGNPSGANYFPLAISGGGPPYKVRVTDSVGNDLDSYFDNYVLRVNFNAEFNDNLVIIVDDTLGNQLSENVYYGISPTGNSEPLIFNSVSVLANIEGKNLSSGLSEVIGSPTHYALSDLNKDGFDDIAIVSAAYTSTVITPRPVAKNMILMSNVDGSYTASELPGFTKAGGRIAILNLANKDSIIVSCGGDNEQSSSEWNYRGDHFNVTKYSFLNETFTDVKNLTPDLAAYTPFCHGIATGDFDNNGLLDVVTTDFHGEWGFGQWPVFLSGGDGSFALSIQMPDSMSQIFPNPEDPLGDYAVAAFSIESGDFNGDNLDDMWLGLAINLKYQPYFRPVVLVNDGTGNMNTGLQTPLPALEAFNIALDGQPINLNKDEFDDLLITYANSDYLGRYHQVLLNLHGTGFADVTGSLMPYQNLSLETGHGLVIDLDNDGDLDIFSDFPAKTNRYYLNNGNGYFVGHNLSGISGLPEEIDDIEFMVVDINNDSTQDLVFFQVSGGQTSEDDKITFYGLQQQ